MVEDETLIAAAGRIADGEMVDWASITSSLPSDDTRAIADELAVVAQIAAGHRQLHQLLPVLSDTPPSLMADRSRWGHLDLLNVVGRGSFGTVYRAWDTRLERLVALKLFHGASNPDEVMQEGRMLARVRQENVVTVYGADVIDGVAGIWMELVHGKTLDNLVKGEGAMTVRDAAAAGVDIARALAAIHGAGLLHCDVKAQNVVRESAGRVVLMDLGAGRVAPEPHDGDQLSDVAGTPRYMAPELFRHGATATRVSDIYSFGVLLYFLVSGKFPVDGKTLGELKRAHAAGEAHPLASVVSGLPPAFLDIVSRALDPDPSRRPASATELQSALAPLAGEPAAEAPRPFRWWPAAAAAAALVAVFAVARPMLTPPAAPAPAVRSIAVLPIKNLTGDESVGYLSDALTEVLISNLARLPGVRVPSFAAVASMRNRPGEPSAAANELGVELLLAGTITQVQPTLRLSIQLVDPNGTARWGDEISQPRSTMIAAQADIVRRIAEHLEIDLRPEDRQRLIQLALDPRAEEAYLRGLAATIAAPARADEAAARFRETIEIAPAFAPAWAELAFAEMLLLEQSASVEYAARVAQVRQLADRAIELDNSLGRSYAARGTVEFYYDWDFDRAEATLRSGLEQAPNDGFLRQRLSMLLAARGRLDEAILLGREALRLEPLMPFRSMSLGTLYYYARDYDRAAAEMERALSVSPGFAVAEFGLGRIYSAQGRHDAAVDAIASALARVGYPEIWLAEYARVLIAAGRAREASAVLDKLSRSSDFATLHPEQEAYRLITVGQPEPALAVLDKAISSRSLGVLWLAVDPRVDPLRSDPRFHKLLQRIGTM